MAIATDPDLLDRQQVIFGPIPQDLSLYEVGAFAGTFPAQRSTGATTIGTKTFSDSGATFTTWGISPGDVICLFSGSDARHFVIDTVDSQTSITVLADNTFTNFAASETSLIYEIRDPTGGSIQDGASEQAVYSFTKEEWRTDSEQYDSDDLIRHPFPWEPITPTQFEIGGGDAHEDWDIANLHSRNLLRFGGYRVVNQAGTAQFEYMGAISLGGMDADAQPYYQQNNATQAPVNFAFTGVVNEPVFIWQNGGNDYRTYFKAFLRKKGKTYSQYDLIVEQNISQLTYKDYSFPLSHAADGAITQNDEALGRTSPWVAATTTKTLSGAQTDGVATAGTGTFTSATAAFSTNNVRIGDVLQITAGADVGYYHIIEIVSDTEITISIADGAFSGGASQTFQVLTSDIILPRTDGSISDIDGSTGQLVSATGGFSGTIGVGDLLVITEAASVYRGVYKVSSVTNDTTLVIETGDQNFGTASNIDFYIKEPGMSLQYKWEDVTLAATGNLTFADANPDTITRASGSWVTDGVVAGDVIIITGSASNDGSYTVASVTALVATLVATDELTAEGPVGATATCKRGFKRTVNTVVYGFEWRLFGNNGLLSECYQYTQFELRQAFDIDFGPGVARGDITDQMMTFSTPTGVTQSMYIDNLSSADINNVTWTDATGVGRLEPFSAAGVIAFNDNLVNDANGFFWMFFENDDAGDNTGRDYGTKNAIIVQDADSLDIKGTIPGGGSESFTYDYDGNIQRGAASAGTDAPVVVVAIGLATAQFVLAKTTIGRSKANAVSLVSALERTYSNP